MSRYELVTHWHLNAPIGAVWDALHDVAGWPKWWSYVLDVEPLERGDGTGMGALHRITWGSALPYQMTFNMRTSVIQRPTVIEAIAEGDLNGVGRWTLTQAGAATEVRYDCDVSTARAWMNVMSPLLGPMFRWNHGQVMADGAQGLARYLAAK
jgi:uncharacterized protein YndB with AHSA1/START domain